MEQFSASIEIGGEISRSRLQALLDAIKKSDVSLDWGDAQFIPRDEEDLQQAVVDGRLWFCDDSASYGRFSVLEKELPVLGLSFTRTSDSGIEWDGEIVDWRPGMVSAVCQICNWEWRPIVLVDSVERALKLLRAGNVTGAAALLSDICIDIPELPPFVIV